jgi:flagellar biosynthesis protein FlhG
MRSHAKINQIDTSLAVPNIVLVASGKGGVGKTWFSISYAHSCAKKGKKILLFDGDLGLANVDVQLGLMPEQDLGHFLNGDCLIEDSITHYDAGGFDILAGRSGCGSLASMPFSRMETLQNGLTHIAQNYDQVVIDLGAGIGGTVRQLSQLASKCIVITTDEPTSMTDAYAVIKYTRSYLPDLEMYVVVNQVENHRDGERIFETLKNVCQNFIKYTPKLAGIIPKDSHVPDSIRNQQPMFMRHPHTEAAVQIEKIVGNIG